MKRTVLGAVLLAFSPLWACSPDASPKQAAAAEAAPPVIEGAWHVTQVNVESGLDAGAHTVDVQPAIYIFAKSHYAITAVNGFSARPYLGVDPSEAELGRAFAPFTGSAGTYTAADGKLVLSQKVSMDPAGMTGSTVIERDLAWVDGKLVLTTSTPEAGILETELTRLDGDMITISPEAERLRGVWRRVEMTIDSGEDAGTHVDDMQPGYYIFSPPYFAGNYVSTFAPRPALSAKPADAELGRVLDGFSSFAGTYTVREGVLIFRPLVAKNPDNMRGRPFQAIATEWAGEDVWFIYTSQDGRQNRVRLTRVQD